MENKTEQQPALKVWAKGEGIDRDKLIELQREDQSLKQFRDTTGPRTNGQYEVDFEVKDDILYRLFSTP